MIREDMVLMTTTTTIKMTIVIIKRIQNNRPTGMQPTFICLLMLLAEAQNNLTQCNAVSSELCHFYKPIEHAMRMSLVT